jgi:hypothetical protein
MGAGREVHVRTKRGCGWLLAAPAALVVVVALVSALSNLGLPAHSSVVDRLTEVDKARLAEATHLRSTLGVQVWPGWDQTRSLFVVYNESYAFLLGYPATAGNPPAGWTKVPHGPTFGTGWELVPGETFERQPYFRQRLPDTGETPQAFTVRIGELWAPSFMTKPYAQIQFTSGLRETLPPVVRSLVPYRLMWSVLMGESDAYIAAWLHESFHAFQGETAPARVAAAEDVMALEGSYPWEAAPAEWEAEVDLLADAALAESESRAAALAQQFLDQRAARRAVMGLSDDLIDFERQREWLEGLAKYAELASGRLAGEALDYEPIPVMAGDSEFREYTRRSQVWTQQLGEVRRGPSQEGEIRFYYTGLAQAAILDRLAPGWKDGAFDDGVWLEDLVREAVAARAGRGRLASFALDLQ